MSRSGKNLRKVFFQIFGGNPVYEMNFSKKQVNIVFIIDESYTMTIVYGYNRMTLAH